MSQAPADLPLVAEPDPTTSSTPAEQEVRERLLEAAIQAFARVGFEAASLRAIAEAAGVAYQLIGYYFGSKEDLWRAAFELSYHRRLEIGRSLGFDLNGDLREQFRNHIRSLVLEGTQENEWSRIAMHERLAQTERYRAVVKPQTDELLQRLGAPYHRQLNRLGIISRFAPQETHLIVVALVLGSTFFSDMFAAITGEAAGSLKSVDVLVELLYSICIRGSSRQRTTEVAPIESSVPNEPAPGTAVETAEHEWGEQYGGLGASELARLRQLEVENEHLKQMIGELSLEKRLLQQTAKLRSKSRPK